MAKVVFSALECNEENKGRERKFPQLTKIWKKYRRWSHLDVVAWGGFNLPKNNASVRELGERITVWVIAEVCVVGGGVMIRTVRLDISVLVSGWCCVSLEAI